MRFFRKLKAAWNRYLDDLAEENRKSFGNGRLDCCQINRKENQKEISKQGNSIKTQSKT